MMSTRELVSLVDGRLRPASTCPDSGIVDPNSGERICDRPDDDAAAVGDALEAADRVHQERWATRVGVEGRIEILHRFADALESMAEEIANAEMVSPGLIAAVARPIAAGCADQVRAAVSELEEFGSQTAVPASGSGGPVVLRRDPWGPAVIMPPWNAPTPTAIGKAAAAIAAGCPVIIKAHERAPLSARLWEEAALKAEIPAGVFQVLHGGPPTAMSLAGDPRIRAVALTGGLAAGRSIAQMAAGNFTRLQLELGGLNPAIVLNSVDISKAARALAFGMTKLNGQWCEAPGQVFVPSDLHDELVEALCTELGQLRIGRSTEESTDVGPLVDARHVQSIESQISHLMEAGGSLERAGVVDFETACGFVPAVITGTPADAATDEIFGPVVSVHTYQDVDSVINYVNGRGNGLAGYVFGDNVQDAMATGERLLGGEIKVNGTSLFDLSPQSHQSFWGVSGIGGHGHHDAFEFFRGYRIVGVDNPEAPI